MVYRRCEKCERTHKTNAVRWWKCPHCEHRNYIKRPRPVSRPKLQKYIRTTVDDQSQWGDPPQRLLSSGESIPRSDPATFFLMLLSLGNTNLISIRI